MTHFSIVFDGYFSYICRLLCTLGFMLNIYIKYNIKASYKKKGISQALLCAVFAAWFLLSAGVAGAQVQDCTTGGHPIYSAWNFPSTVCAGQVVPFSVGYDANNTMVLTHPHMTKPDTLFLPDGVPCGNENSCVYSSSINVSGYSGNITSANDIKYVRLNLEHSRAGDLYIKIKCPAPNEQSSVIFLPGSPETNTSCNYTIPNS